MRAAVITAVLLIGSNSAFSQEIKLIPNPSTTGPQDHTAQRAGMPTTISRLAAPSIEKHEGPGAVGGSRLFKGDARGPYDGTFGWDYQGWKPSHVFLGWSHDRKAQPNLGTYKTDGHHVSNIFTFRPIHRVLQPRDP